MISGQTFGILHRHELAPLLTAAISSGLTHAEVEEKLRLMWKCNLKLNLRSNEWQLLTGELMVEG